MQTAAGLGPDNGHPHLAPAQYQAFGSSFSPCLPWKHLDQQLELPSPPAGRSPDVQLLEVAVEAPPPPPPAEQGLLGCPVAAVVRLLLLELSIALAFFSGEGEGVFR